MTDPQQPGSSGFDPKTNSAPDLWAQAATNSGAPVSDSSREPGWERATLEKLAFAALNEQRSARRWKIFFRLAWLALLAAIAFAALRQASPSTSTSTPHTRWWTSRAKSPVALRPAPSLWWPPCAARWKTRARRPWCC